MVGVFRMVEFVLKSYWSIIFSYTSEHDASEHESFRMQASMNLFVDFLCDSWIFYVI